MEELEKIKEAELWKMRAMLSEKKCLATELTLLRMKFEQLSDEAGLYEATLREKYKCKEGDNIDAEGNIIRKPEIKLEAGE